MLSSGAAYYPEKVVLTFKSVDEILKRNRSNISY